MPRTHAVVLADGQVTVLPSESRDEYESAAVFVFDPILAVNVMLHAYTSEQAQRMVDAWTEARNSLKANGK